MLLPEIALFYSPQRAHRTGLTSKLQLSSWAVEQKLWREPEHPTALVLGFDGAFEGTLPVISLCCAWVCQAHRRNSLLMKLTQEPTQCPPASRGHSGHGPKVRQKVWGNLRSQHPPHCCLPWIGTTLLISAPTGLRQNFRLCYEDMECTCVHVFHKAYHRTVLNFSIFLLG